jgi:hypothetical protein
MNSAEEQRRGWWKGACAIVIMLCAVPAFAQLARKRAVRQPLAEEEEVTWERYLVGDASEPTIRFAVAHQHRAGGCYGFLYISHNEMRYVVKSPAEDREHGFQYSRASLTEARQWRVLGSSMPEVEFKFANGKTYHFFRVRETLVDEPGVKLRWEDVRTWQPLAQAALHFDQVLLLAQRRAAARGSAAPPGSAAPKVRVMEPAVADPSVPVEVSEPLLTLRGAALDSKGVLSITVNDHQAELRSTGDIRVVEFSVPGLPLQEGLNRVTIVATNVDHQSTQLVVPVWLRSKGAAATPPQVGTPQPRTQPSSPVATLPPARSVGDSGERVTVEVFSDPSGADILLDGDFMGNTPSILKLRLGDHVVNLQLPGFKPWQQDLKIAAGAGLTTVRATLDKIQ